jgi:hypothetical protein
MGLKPDPTDAPVDRLKANAPASSWQLNNTIFIRNGRIIENPEPLA